MQLSEALNLLDRMMAEKQSRKLTPLEREIVARAWTCSTYRDIADYQEQTVKNNAVRLWKTLSQLLNIKVNKQNIRQILEDLDRSRLPIESIDSTQRGKFFGRVTELCQLQTVIITQRDCNQDSQQYQRLLIYGMKGIGKTTLAQKLAENLAPKFDRIVWISLADAPPLQNFLAIVVREVAGGRQAKLSQQLECAIEKTIVLLQQQQCLFILDNADAIFDKNHPDRDLVSEYARFFNTLDSVINQNFWVMITVEKPILIDANYPQIELKGLDRQSCQMMLEDSGLVGISKSWDVLVTKYHGNPQYLKIVANTIRDIFNGNIGNFLDANILIFDRINGFLSDQLDSLTNIEAAVLMWIVIISKGYDHQGESVTLDRLRQKFDLHMIDFELVKILDKLVRNYLLEVKENSFIVPDLVAEYLIKKHQDLIVEEIWTKKFYRLHIYPILPNNAKPIIIKLIEKSLDTQPRPATLRAICSGDLSQFKVNIQSDLVARLTELCTRLHILNLQNICTPPPKSNIPVMP